MNDLILQNNLTLQFLATDSTLLKEKLSAKMFSATYKFLKLYFSGI